MIINIVTPSFSKNKFSGGAICLLNYANELGKRGHQVNVVPIFGSEKPEWFPKPWEFKVIHESKKEHLVIAIKEILKLPIGIFILLLKAKGKIKLIDRKFITNKTTKIARGFAHFSNFAISRGAAIDTIINNLPDADVTIATDAETAYPVALAGKGRLFYFSQHYEPLFWKERSGGLASKHEAELTYKLGLNQIVNSPWLASKLKSEVGLSSISICSNAIDHRIFFGKPKPRISNDKIILISYGGRDAEWKGFREMCEGVKKARLINTGVEIEWRVYGDSLIPPNNSIASYISLGFLNPIELAKAYREADILLSASWYESFPLFPIEAMACGLPAITTQHGTEVYAKHLETAYIVSPQSPDDICNAITYFIKSEADRLRVAENGRLKSLEFNWDKSSENMLKIIEDRKQTSTATL